MNKAILMGRLVKDPELKQTTNGISYASFTIAVDRRFKSASGERETDFIPIRTWRQQAEFAAKYLRKGSKICVVGSIQVRNYENNGERRSFTEVVADELYFADSNRSQNDSGTSNNFSNNNHDIIDKPIFAKPTNDAFSLEDTESFFNQDDDGPTPFKI